MTTREEALTALCDYVAAAGDVPLPAVVAEKTRYHLLDTLAAMITGARLEVGRVAIRYIRGLGGRREALVVGTRHLTTAINAALANGMLAHADETDDSHAPSISHPGCVIVPAALAMAERHHRGGSALLRAVALGYDVLTRVNMALGPRHIFSRGHGPYSIGGAWGAAAAAGALAGFDASQVRHLLSNVAQQTSGIATWMRDERHVEKALHFGGMPARNGVSAATMIEAGFTGIDEVLSGRGNFLDAFSDRPDVERLVQGLGEDYEILRTNIKKWSVGSPIQAALDSMQALIAEHGLHAEQVAQVTIRLPAAAADVVDDRSMPDINVQHCLAVMLLDGGLTFASSHDYSRMQDPRVLEMKQRMTLQADEELEKARPVRQAIIELTTRDGVRLSHRTRAVKGTADAPMDRGDVTAKVRDLLEPLLGPGRCAQLLDTTWQLDSLQDVTDLRALLHP